MTVFAVNLTHGHDTSNAEQYGDVKNVNIRYVYGDEIDGQQRMPQAFIDKLEQAACEFDPDRDYLLIVGDHLQLVDFAARLGSKYGTFRVLRYDKKAQGYIPVEVNHHA